MSLTQFYQRTQLKFFYRARSISSPGFTQNKLTKYCAFLSVAVLQIY